ncbi:DUF4430 domain-containing protein [Viridibacillus sp. YIM B01967]|uniref:DUF4430 domain-containing protein n=1 Tax=Viridibacillus soli TaxID=2798301 RepID=A0ABS1H3B3_9BACL|nr:DUF4430 domain-containing protein [Viridibacillus soli]MBK3493647.1 DUF4430 domain-containing protein [Viridibacillus soli]
MKKCMSLWLMMILALFVMTGCKIQSVEEYNNQTEQEKSIRDTNDAKVVVKEKKEDGTTKDEVKKDSTKDSKVTKNELVEKRKTPQNEAVDKTVTKNEQPTKQPSTSTPKTNSTSTEKTTSKNPSTSSNKETTTAKDKVPTTKQPINHNNTQKPSAAIKEEPVKKKEYVTISISAATLIKHWDMLKPALQNEKYVPKNGVILKSTMYEILSEDETVWSILKRATREHGIHLEYQGAGDNKYGSVYIQGMNHLYERDAGSSSGWMFAVNGVFPDYGGSSITVKNGDNIQWQYTVDLGRDLGTKR